MKKFVMLLRLIVALLLVAFIIQAPSRLSAELLRNPYREFLGGGDDDGWSGIITVWHVVGFKTYQGSVTAFLESCAAKYEKANSGVYIEVLGLSPDAAQERISRGERPDVWSLPMSELDMTDFLTLSDALGEELAGIKPYYADGGGLKALPYLMSGYYLISNTLLVAELGLELPDMADMENIGTALQAAIDSKSTLRYGALCAQPISAAMLGLSGKLANDGDFNAGQVPFMIGDARALGDLNRKEDAFTIDARPLSAYTDEVQYIGMDINASPERIAHGTGLISLILSQEQQSRLTALGAIPVIRMDEAPAYSESMLKALYDAYQAPVMPNPAEYAKQLDMLNEEAQGALDSNASAKASFDKRIMQLCQ